MTAFKYHRLDKNNAAVLLVDHQTGLTNCVQDFSPDDFKNNVLALGDAAKYFKLPTILTTSFEEGPNGPLVPELKALFPEAPYIARPGNINAWDNEDFVKAVKATGRNQLIIAGIVTEVCVAFPALSALEAGYEVFICTDASGTFNKDHPRRRVVPDAAGGRPVDDVVRGRLRIASRLAQRHRRTRRLVLESPAQLPLSNQQLPCTAEREMTAMPAQKSGPATIDEYLAGVKPDQRAVLEQLRRTIRAAAPKAEEGISYGLAAFRWNGRPLVAFGAGKNHYAFYPMSGGIVRSFQDQLKGFETSKGTIRFSTDKPLPAALVKKLVKARLAELEDR
jgi:uncharacterized protein YdhG (YjbR/CyaY superfamily)/nicotinamidase-related amidase